MGFLDKVKEQGSALAGKAQEGISQGQAKLDEAQAKKKANQLLGELGAWQWAMTQGRDGGVGAVQIERIRGELTAHEAEHGPVDAPVIAAPEPAPPTMPPPAPGDVAPPAAPGTPPSGPPPSAPPVTPPGG